MFSLIVVNDTNNSSIDKKFQLDTILNVLNNQKSKLIESRVEIEPDLYDAYLQEREVTHKKAPREAKFSIGSLYPGTWYLKSIDEAYRRTYDFKSLLNEKNEVNYDAKLAASLLNDQLTKLLSQ